MDPPNILAISSISIVAGDYKGYNLLLKTLKINGNKYSNNTESSVLM